MTASAPTVLGEAMDVAAGILSDAGIAVDWRDCSPDADLERCREGRRAGDRTVRVVSELAPTRRSALDWVVAPADGHRMRRGSGKTDTRSQAPIATL